MFALFVVVETDAVLEDPRLRERELGIDNVVVVVVALSTAAAADDDDDKRNGISAPE